MSERFDSIEIDILSTLLETPGQRLQRKDIRDAVFEKNKNVYKEKDTFNVILQRKLDHLRISKLLKKDDVGHRQVYYYIPNEAKPEIEKLKLKKEIKDRAEEIDEIDELKRLNWILKEELEYYRTQVDVCNPPAHAVFFDEKHPELYEFKEVTLSDFFDRYGFEGWIMARPREDVRTLGLNDLLRIARSKEHYKNLKKFKGAQAKIYTRLLLELTDANPEEAKKATQLAQQLALHTPNTYTLEDCLRMVRSSSKNL